MSLLKQLVSMFRSGGKMIKLGLVGKDISHSKSKETYEKILNKEIAYTLFDYLEVPDLPQLDELFEKVDGVSITAPYKTRYSKSVEIVGDISALGIINCIRKRGDLYEGINTDYIAVLDYLKGFSAREFDFVLLGNGSMAQVTSFALETLGYEYKNFYRSKDENFSNLDFCEIRKNSLKKLFVINSCSRSYEYSGPIEKGIFFWDLNYLHKKHTSRLSNSSIRYVDGLGLLRSQATFALDFWGIKY